MFYIQKILCLLFLFGLPVKFLSQPEKDKISKRIIGGKPCKNEKYSFAVSLKRSRSGSHRCGGSLLNAFWVLTAAHCVGGHLPIFVTAGRNTPDEQVRIVKEKYPHPEFYRPVSLRHDIALLELNHEIKESKYISYVNIPSRQIKKELKMYCPEVLVMGWGRMEPNVKNKSPIIQCVKLPVLSRRECARYLPAYWIHQTSVCTISEDNKDKCKGDSGGPLVCEEYNNVQLGIVSGGKFNVPCGHPGRAGFYARVDKYLDFIESTMLNSRYRTNCASITSSPLTMLFLIYLI